MITLAYLTTDKTKLLETHCLLYYYSKYHLWIYLLLYDMKHMITALAIVSFTLGYSIGLQQYKNVTNIITTLAIVSPRDIPTYNDMKNMITTLAIVNITLGSSIGLQLYENITNIITTLAIVSITWNIPTSLQ